MKLIAYDLGTGGVKASLYSENFETLAKSFIEYDTFYPGPNMHEQRPEDWWKGVIQSTRILMEESGSSPSEIGCIALSGHSLVAIPLDKDGNVLLEQVPIWSDTRALEECDEFFRQYSERDWYMTTGNGFPAPCYSLFKVMWMKKHQPEVFARCHRIIGSKDYINMMLTGTICTDHSYASGTGAYDLKNFRMMEDFIRAAGLPPELFAQVTPSHEIVGKVTGEAAAQTGLAAGTPVACGGVDNACMALGALGGAEGKIYTSLGSSSWIPVNSSSPILDDKKKPYVFAHIQEGMYTSAFSIFSGGSSLRWVREQVCRDLTDADKPYVIMDQLAEKAPIGSNGILFNPSLAGGTSQDKSIHIRGAYLGLHLGTTREDMIRAAMEGIALNLRVSLDTLKQYTALSDEMLFCGGGSKSPFWMQMFADCYNMTIVKTNIDQDAASVGAAAIGARAVGLWRDYSPIEQLHMVQSKSVPVPENVRKYEKLLEMFRHASDVAADLGEYMREHSL